MLAIVIAIDVSRAVASGRTARRHGSPALAANAIHFTSDLAGSLAVLAGTILVATGHPKGDAIAGLAVAVLVIGLAVRLMWQSVEVLMDRTSADAEAKIRAALAGLREPLELRRVRARYAAGRHFADLVVGVPPDKGVVQAHATADQVEDAVQAALGNADVVVHVEPVAPEGGLRERATAAAATVPEVREVHNVRVMRVGDAYELSLHVKLPRELNLAEAHDVIERLEAEVRAEVPELRRVHTHIEPLSRTDWAMAPPARDDRDGARRGRGHRARDHRRAPRRRPVPRRRARARRARDDHAARRAAAALGAPARGPDRGGRPRALPRARGRDRPHRAHRRRPDDRSRLAQVDRGRQPDRQQHAGVAEVARDERGSAP